MGRPQLHRLLLLATLLGSLHLVGCNSLVSRFISRSIERLGAPVEPVLKKVTSPLRPDVGLSILWVGHATVLIQIHDKVFLTDPAFTRTVGLLARRSVEPGLDPAAIAKLDYTLISHIHFDHFSYGSLDMLPKHGMLLIPFGAAPYTPEFGFALTREMKRWETLEEDGVRITAVPVRHFGGRYGFDISWYPDRGYTGYIIEYKGKTIFFAGDTGYDPELFKEIGRRFKVDVALLPIAPVEPREFMQRVHVDPKEAVQIFEDVRAKIMIPMHHRTFFQGLEPTAGYAQDLLEKVIEEIGCRDRIRILEIGEQWISDQ